MDFVIGSGPAGIACASALLARGRAVTMLDAGLQLEPEREAVRNAMAPKPKAEWTAAERALVAPVSGAGVPEKLSYGSDYPYRGTPPGSLRGSYAQGGLSNVWGSAIMPWRAQDMPGWPVTAEELAPGYTAATRLLPVSARTDDLATEWPLFGTPGAMLPPGRQSERLLAALHAKRDELRQAGVQFGAARLAVDANPCILCGACLAGCPRELIHSARHSLPALQAAGLEYVSGVRVRRLEETQAGVKITADGQAFEADRVFLAAGALNSTEIMLRSLGRAEAVLKDSQYFVLPLLQAGAAKGVAESPLHTLAQLFIEIDDPAVSPFGVHLQIYGYSDVLAAAVHAKLPRWAAARLLERMMVIQGYLHSAHSGRIAVRLETDRLSLRPERNPETAPHLRALGRKLRAMTGAMRAWPVMAMLQQTEPGRGFHTGGSFPMSATPAPGETDRLGRPPGTSRIHMVDAAVLPSIAATTITLTAMANAWRIGHEAG
jgi:choline dehydrogenase-like flavoprotein